LIIIAAVLAIAAIVVLFLTGAFTATTGSGDVGVCKQVASACAVELATSSSTECSDTLCNISECQGLGVSSASDCSAYTTAVAACKAGKPDCIVAA